MNLEPTSAATVPPVALPLDTGVGTLTQTRPSRGLWRDAWRRLSRNKMAIAGICYLAFLVVVAIFAPVIAPHNPVQSDVKAAGTYRQAAWIDDKEQKKDGSW